MNRPEMIARLIAEEEQASEAFVSGQIQREMWEETLRSVDERLAVMGVQLAYRPWEGQIAIPLPQNSQRQPSF